MALGNKHDTVSPPLGMARRFFRSHAPESVSPACRPHPYYPLFFFPCMCPMLLYATPSVAPECLAKDQGADEVRDRRWILDRAGLGSGEGRGRTRGTPDDFIVG